MTESANPALASLTPEEVTDMLGAGATTTSKVTSVGVEPLAVQGAVCDLARLILDYDSQGPGAPASVVAKIPKADPAVRGAGIAVGLYERERHFYSQLAQAVPLRVPVCYFLGDGDAGEKPLLIEDLSSLRAGDQVTGFSLDETAELVDVLAKMHAEFWESDELTSESLEWLLAPSHPVFRAGLLDVVAASLDAFLVRYTGRLPSDALEKVVEGARRFPEVLDRCGGGPLTLIHFDTRADNWMFGSDGTPCLIDWQGCARMRGVHDIAYMVTGSVATEVQHDHWEALLRRYHDGLIRHGVSDYTWQDCVTHYRQHVTCAMLLMLPMIGTIAIKNERGEALADAILGRAIMHLFEVGSL